MTNSMDMYWEKKNGDEESPTFIQKKVIFGNDKNK